MIPARKNVIGLSGHIKKRPKKGRPVLFDANALAYTLGAQNKQWKAATGTLEPRETNKDFRRWWIAVQSAWGTRYVQVPSYILKETLRGSRRQALKYGDPTEISSEEVAVFALRHCARLEPHNDSFADLALFAEAVLRKKYIVSADAWVVGKAQAAGVIFPTLRNLRFRGAQEATRQAAYDSW